MSDDLNFTFSLDDIPHFSFGMPDDETLARYIVIKGEKGDTGATGPAGADGQDGQDGQNFTPTIVDTLPTVGDQGNLYLTPKNYTTGTASGNPITATITDEAGQIESFQLDGDAFQQSYTGKNLAQPLDKYAYSLNVGATIESQSDGTVVFKTSSSSTSSGLFIYKTTGNNATLCPELFTAGYTVSFDVMATDTCSFEFGVTGNHTTSTISTTKQRVSAATATGAGMVFYNNSRNGATITISNIQVEAGSTSTSFEPYVGAQASPNPDYPQQIQTVTGTQTISINGTNYPISLGSLELCKIGNYQDYIYKDGDDWKVHKAIGKAVLDGTEDWSMNAGGQNPFLLAHITSKLIAPSTSGSGSSYSDHYINANISSSNTNVGFVVLSNGSTQTNIRIRESTMPTVAEFKTRLASDNVLIYTALATPTDTTITDTTLIAQLEAIRTASLENGTNTITNTATGTNLAGDMEFDYYEYDPTNRYDKWLWLRANNAYEEFNEEGGGGGGGSITVDSALSTTSKNPVQNKVVTAAINSKVDSSSLATVATSGSYNDLSNKPTIPTIPTQTSAFTNNGSDGTSTYVEADELATVATTGAYSDLSGTPTIPTATGDLTNDSGFITSADLPTKTSDLTNDGSDGTSTYVEASGLATVATSGSYNDLSNKPTIPTVNNGTLTIRQNGKTLGEFTANQSTNTTVNLTDNSSYSTSEVKTSATWINGKPIYKKTFSFTLADAESTTINHGISNFGLLIKFEGTVVQSSAKNVPIPRTLTDTNYQVGLEGVTTTSFEIDVGSSGPRGKQAYMTLWYTKTTD